MHNHCHKYALSKQFIFTSIKETSFKADAGILDDAITLQLSKRVISYLGRTAGASKP